MRKVYEILENDARLTPKQVATMTGLPEAKVKKIIAEAEKERIIVKYKTMINWEKAGDDRVWAMIEVKMQPQKDVGFDSLAQRIYRFPQVRTLYLVSGTYDLAVFVVGKTVQEVGLFVSQKLAPLEGVQGTVTHFLLKRYKEDGEILSAGGDDRRQPIS
ncbi:MAG: Lrp/AsnC family transcriptional regulator [Dehalococcoidia bacterium]|nr:Lrp/AsnC family transcriptional regulator [Dehalococcoidia bacterium]